MRFHCPACKRPLVADNINIRTDLALCADCGNIARPSMLADADFDADALKRPPKGAWHRETMNEHVVGATTRSPVAFFLVPFMCVWSGGSLGGIYGSQIRAGEFNLFFSLFGLPFLIGSVVFWSLALMAICGKVEVRLRDRRGVIFVGVGAIGWKRPVDLAEVDRITQEGTRTNYPGHRGSSILLEGKTRLRFGTNLSEPRRLFILDALKTIKARGAR